MSDLISRQDVEKAIQGLHIGDVNFFTKLRERIDAIPSAEPEERRSMVCNMPKGSSERLVGRCSCGYVLDVFAKHYFKYCPNCGCRLEW